MSSKLNKKRLRNIIINEIDNLKYKNQIQFLHENSNSEVTKQAVLGYNKYRDEIILRQEPTGSQKSRSESDNFFSFLLMEPESQCRIEFMKRYNEGQFNLDEKGNLMGRLRSGEIQSLLNSPSTNIWKNFCSKNSKDKKSCCPDVERQRGQTSADWSVLLLSLIPGTQFLLPLLEVVPASLSKDKAEFLSRMLIAFIFGSPELAAKLGLTKSMYQQILKKIGKPLGANEQKIVSNFVRNKKLIQELLEKERITINQAINKLRKIKKTKQAWRNWLKKGGKITKSLLITLGIPMTVDVFTQWIYSEPNYEELIKLIKLINYKSETKKYLGAYDDAYYVSGSGIPDEAEIKIDNPNLAKEWGLNTGDITQYKFLPNDYSSKKIPIYGRKNK